MNIKTIVTGAAAVLAFTSSARAQDVAVSTSRANARFTAGVSFLGAAPRGDFAEQIVRAFGLGANLRYRFDTEARFALRLDADWLNHGWGRSDVQLRSQLGGTRTIDLWTSNDIVFLEVGPEFTGTGGGVRPYVGIGAGAAWFVTDASGHSRAGRVHETTSVWHEDVVFSFGGRVGVRAPLRWRTAMDLGVQYHRSSAGDFVRKGGLTVDDLGDIVIDPVRAQADVLVFQAGVSVPLTRRKDRAAPKS